MMERKLATVATRECEDGLRLMVRSAQAHGWNEPVYVYTPDKRWNPLINGVIMVPCQAWWNCELSTVCRNSAALCKPEVFLCDKYPARLTTYCDGADVFWFKNPAILMNEFDESQAIIGARPFRVSNKPIHKHGKVIAFLGRRYIVRDGSDYVNNGLLVGRKSPELDLIMWTWKSLLSLVDMHGPFDLGNVTNVLAGDQEAFNVARRIFKGQINYAVKDRRVLDIAPEWNYRGRNNIAANIKWHEGKRCPVDETGKRVHMIHASGNSPAIPDWIEKKAVEE